jgi:hypothetical protein
MAGPTRGFLQRLSGVARLPMASSDTITLLSPQLALREIHRKPPRCVSNPAPSLRRGVKVIISAAFFKCIGHTMADYPYGEAKLARLPASLC